MTGEDIKVLVTKNIFWSIQDIFWSIQNISESVKGTFVNVVTTLLMPGLCHFMLFKEELTKSQMFMGKSKFLFKISPLGGDRLNVS